MSTATHSSMASSITAIYNQPTDHLRFIEVTTEGSHLESLFLLCDHARDSFFRQIQASVPDLPDSLTVVRSMQVRLDHHWPQNFPVKPDAWNPNRTRPRSGQLYRVETRVMFLGTKSLKLQHRFSTVPASQVKRDFNDRGQDAEYSHLADGEEPERLFASAEGAVVFIQWHEDASGRVFFRPTAGPFNIPGLLQSSILQFASGDGPRRRTDTQPRPDHAFRSPFLLRQSDKDALGHVTNSRYATIVHDVLTWGMQQGYYANGSGESRTEYALPVMSLGPHGTNESQLASLGQTSLVAAVPAGARHYKKVKVHEMYVGYEAELKVKPGVVVWSWVEREKLQRQFDVIQFEIYSTDETGVEQVISQCRVLTLEETARKASL
ncbi:hypothetical protein BG004_007276 [Podila humilis]|nr:hypothetical protein BG004_007276 [Podila humilis]